MLGRSFILKRINLLGATGSIGMQTIDIVRNHPEEFKLTAVAGGRNLDGIRRIAEEFQPELICVQLKDDAERLKTEYPNRKIVYGHDGLIEAATYVNGDIVVNAVMGSIGLIPTMQAMEAGKQIALANKETLVTAGHLVMEAAEKYNTPILPVDSEHSAIFQALQGERAKNIERLIITASGGSFRDRTRDELKNVTVEDALNHPNWSMGAKITIDSATMMNKGLEVIEAHWLFNLPYEQIDVLLHQESIIHSMVEFHDSSVIAQLGTPDMRVPIQYALSYPDRLPLISSKRLNLADAATLHFKKMDFDRYPCLQYAYNAGRIGGSMPTVLNAANEVAVGLFLQGKIPFLAIEELVEKAMNRHQPIINPELETIQEVDQDTRKYIESLY